MFYFTNGIGWGWVIGRVRIRVSAMGLGPQRLGSGPAPPRNCSDGAPGQIVEYLGNVAGSGRFREG